MTTDENLKLILEATTECDSRIFDLLIEHKKKIEELASPDIVLEKIEKACNKTAKKASDYESEDLLSEALLKAAEYVPNRTEGKRLLWITSYYDAMITREGFLDYIQAAPIVWTEENVIVLTNYVLEHFEDTSSIEYVERKMADIVKKNKSSWQVRYLWARTLAASGKTKPAQKTAKKALKLAKQDTNAVEQINQFLNTI